MGKRNKSVSEYPVVPDISSIPRWLLEDLAAICKLHQEKQTSGRVRIKFIKGHVKLLAMTHESEQTDESETTD